MMNIGVMIALSRLCIPHVSQSRMLKLPRIYIHEHDMLIGLSSNSIMSLSCSNFFNPVFGFVKSSHVILVSLAWICELH
jgi:hypothetical protein